jgi:ribonuclease P protein component
LSGRLGYPKNRRLDTPHIAAAFRHRPVARTRYFTVYRRRNSLAHARLGLVIPKRLLPRAVDRNRVKRQLREWFRLNHAEIAGHDWLIRLIAAPIARAEVRTDMETAFRQIHAE